MAYESALARLASLNNKKAEADYSAPALSDYQELEEEKKSGGKILRGAGYLGEKLAIGFVQANEAITDLVVGGLADVIGADDFAKRQFEKGWFENWYTHPDRWYDAGTGMQVAGDISQGIGAMIPAIAATAVATYFTGGGATPVVVGALTTGLSATGSGVSQAVQESGELNADAYLYGLAQGATETALELATAKIGTGFTKVSKAALKAFGKETAETVVKSGAKYALKELGKEFASEAFEEGMSAMLDPVWQKLTYNPDADINPLNNAKEIGYSALVGGLTGVIMGGGTMAFNSTLDLKQGKKIQDAGREDGVVSTAKEILAKQPLNDGDEFYATLKNDIETYEQNVANGKDNSLAQKKLLARMQRNNTYAVFDPVIKNSALKTLHNADAVAERFNSMGIVDANGNPVTISAEQIRGNVDISDPKSIVKALKTNDVLRTLAVMDTVGQLTMKVGAFAENIDTPTQTVTQDDINNFVKNADEKTFAEVSRKLGIPPEMWRVMTADEFNAHLARYTASEEGSREIARAKLVRQAKSLPDTSAKNKLPSTPRSQKNGTIRRYKVGDVDIAIIKENGKYTIYDYTTKNATRELTLTEVQEKLKSISENTETKVDQKVTETDEKSSLAKEYREAETFARENIENYDNLTDPVKRAIEHTIVEARANGLSEADVRTFAKFSANSGINVSFDKRALIEKIENGEAKFADGFFDGNNTIYVNKDSKRKYSAVIFHELMHSLYKNTGTKAEARLTKKLMKEAYKKMPKERRQKIEAGYKAYYESINQKLTNDILLDEITAFYTEDMLTDIDVLSFLEGEVPGLTKRITSFFNKSAQRHSGDEHLSRAARKYARKFRELYNSITERNKGMNASIGSGGDSRYSLSSMAYSFFGDKEVTVKDFEDGSYRDTEGYKNYVNQCLNNMRQTSKNFNEDAALNEIKASIDGIVEVAVAMKKAGYDIMDSGAMRSKRDSKDRLLFSSLEPNSDYFTSSDISTICDKRINFAEIYDEIVRREEEMNVPKGKRFFDNVDNYFVIHKIMADMGLTQPCRQCYVESMRKNLAPMANAFLKLVQETDSNNKQNDQLYHKSGKNKGELKTNNAKLRENLRSAIETEEYDIKVDDLTVEMLTTSKGLIELKLQAPLIYEAFNSFYGQSKPKMPKTATPFRFGELTALLTDDRGNIRKGLVEKIRSTGGFRLQSYSDFQIQNFADVLQVIFEAGTLGLNGHAYTKVPAFLDATKNTNLKRNISIFMYNDGGQWKIDRNDSFPYELDKIYDIVKSDESGNTSIIAVVQNEDMAAWVMANDNIGFFIPFHKSGLKMGTVRETIVKEGGREIKGYSNIKDHTRQQTEVWAKTTSEHKANTKVDKPINIYSDGLWDFDNKAKLSKKGLIVKNLKAYIDACEKAGYLPKFREYVMNNKKGLDNVLAYSKELGFVASDATIDDISFEYKGYRIPYGYYKCLGDFGMFTPDGKASPIETLSLKDYNFKEAAEFFSNAESVRRTEILQQIANGTEREKYRNSSMTTAEIAEEVQKKRLAVVNKVAGSRAALDIGTSDSKSTAYVKANEKVDAESLIDYIDLHRDIDYKFSDDISPEFRNAIKKFGNLAHSRLYRGMEAAELDFIKKNGYIKSNSSYNFSYQQGQTRLSPRITTAYVYATSFAPTEIRSKFYEKGAPSYIVEIANFEELGIINEDGIESYTEKEIDKKYITRIIELTYDAKSETVKARDITIDGMNTAKGKIHGVPEFVRDKVTGTILFKHQDQNGVEDGKYISEKNPGMLFDYKMVKEYEGTGFDYNSFVGISGNESNLEPYKYPKSNFDSDIENTPQMRYNERELFDPYKIESPEIRKNLPSDFLRMLAHATSDVSEGETRTVYVSGYIFEATGYMQGEIIAPYNENTKKLLKRKAIDYDQIDSTGETASSWIEDIQNAKGRSGGNSGLSQRGKPMVDDRLFSSSSDGGISRDNERVRKDSKKTESKVKNGRAALDIDSLSDVDVGNLDSWFESLSGEELAQLLSMDNPIADISDELDVKPSKIRVLFRRDGLGNIYSDDNDIAVMKQARIDEAIEDSGATRADYARKYITRISPTDFIDLTVAQEHADRNVFDAEVEGDSGSKMADYDYAKALEDSRRSPYLQINRTTGQVIGHNGRHRLRALEIAGIKAVEIEVQFFDEDGSLIKDNAETIDSIAVSSQFDTDIETKLKKVIPLNESHRAEIESTYGEKAHPNANVRYALDLDNLPDTTESVGATRTKYAPTLKGKVFDAATKFYIETVDETFGLQRYLEKVGGNKEAAATINMARASRSQAQTMIGSEQYNIFGDKVEKMGESLQNILAPINKLTDKSNAGKAARAERSKAFDDYLLNLLNVDRMTLEQRSLAELAEYTSELQELEAKATEAVKAYRSAQKELKALKGRRDAEAVAERKKLNDKIAKAKIEIAALESRIKPLKETIDNFEVMKNKPVFDANEKRANAVTAEESQAIADRYEKKYPQFKEVAEKLYKYLDNLQQMRVEAGLITQEAVDRMKALYPHYVPAYRDTKGGVSVVKGKNNVQVSSTVKSAKGGGQNILNVQNSIAEQTEELMRAGNINRIATAIYEAALNSNDTEFVEIKSREKVSQIAEDAEPTVIERPKNNQITFYYKGEKITMSVSREIFLGFEGLYSPSVDYDGIILGSLQKLNTGFKSLITQYSPAFAVRNVVRDLQDAGINSKHPVEFYKQYAMAWKAMLSNSKEWQLYRAMGGFSSTVFTLEGLESTVGSRGFTDLRSIFDNANDKTAITRAIKSLPRHFKATIEGIGTLNAMLEQVTRFAEFKNSLAHGADLQTALFDSAEVTTNFGRKGRLTKGLNATVMPFLNPAIQGFDKMIRNFKDLTKYRGKDLAMAIAQLIGKLVILGIAPIVANMWMYEDDEDYEKLRDADKENNFLIKIGDGQFIKIPRGRVAGVVGSFYRRSALTLLGEDADWKGFVDNAISNVTPVENVSRTIFSPFVDVKTNTTWYGGAIEGREFEDTAPRDRYDESTSDIAIALAKIVPEFLNYSPKKIHYLLDQYSGVIGDFALPATTAKNKGTVGDQVKSYGKNFVIDSETSNKISSKFYELYDEVQYAKTAGDEAAIYRLRYLNKVKSNTSALYKEKKAIQADTSLSATDRIQQARVVQGLINSAQQNAMADIKLVDKAIEATKGIKDEDERFTEITHLVFGAQTALEWYNKSVYEKASLINSAGLDYEDYYYYYFSVKDLESDKDKQGNTIEGSKRKKVISAISEMGLSAEQTLLLIATSGYAIKDNDIRGMTAARANRLLIQYIMKQKLTKEQKEELAKQCGFTVKNGKIILKS